MEPSTARPAPAEDADIASMACQFLISQNYLLSAFELMVEAQVQCAAHHCSPVQAIDPMQIVVTSNIALLQESGNEQQVEMLSHFFSDRTKFPPEKLAEFELGDGA